MQFGFVVIFSFFAISQGYFGGLGIRSGCYLLLAQKLRHRDFLVDKKVSVNSLLDCKKECDITFINCKSFSYNTDRGARYDDNCLLSRREPETLILREGADLTYGRDYVFYGKFSELRCQAAYNSLKTSSNRHFGLSANSVGRCFRQARNGAKISNRYIRQTVTALTIPDCELSCLIAAFVCRGFNFKSKIGRVLHVSDNCELSGQDSYRINFDDKKMFYNHFDYDFYERISFSGECGTYSRTNYPRREDKWKIPSSSSNNFNSGFGIGSQIPFSSSNQFVGGYGIGSQIPSTSSNNLIGGFGIGSNVPFSSSNNFFGGFGIGSGIPDINNCFTLKKKYTRPDMRFILKKESTSSLQDCKRKCMENKSCKSFAFRRENTLSRWPEKNCYLSDYSVDVMNSRYDLIPDTEFDLYQADLRYGRCSDFRESRSNPYAREGGYKTVSGIKCYRSRCREDANAKYYFCDTDNAGSWDYCCRPDEVCRTHIQSDIAWCHVGSKQRDQWRPCVSSLTAGRSFLMESETYPNKSLLAVPSAKRADLFKGSNLIELKDLNSLIESEGS